MTATRLPPAVAGVPEIFTSELGRSGPRIVLLHGLFGQGRNWTGVAKALSTDYRITLVDLPDHGRSAWTEHFSYVTIADALADLLAGPTPGAAPSDPVHLVGHSMGGKVAMTVALRHPGLVASLVVVDVAPVDYQRMGSFSRYVAGMRGLDLAAIPDRATADAGLAAAVPDPTVRSFLLQNLRRQADPPGWRWQLNLDLLGDELAEVGGWPELDVLPYPGPVLWLAGADSDYITATYAPAMRRLFPRVQLVTVKNSGHWLHTEQPEIFVAAIRRFVHPH
ncbi:MAG TPA: alpha/beta fold hydrolase [Microlunatus sp.]